MTVAWNHNLHFHPWILERMPQPCDRAIDVGTGDGALIPKLAPRARRVTAVDVSEEMIGRARRNVRIDNVEFMACDFMRCALPGGSFDFLVAVAALHHLPFAPAILRAATLLRTGGVLAIVGLARRASLADTLWSVLSIPAARIARVRHGWWESPAFQIEPEMAYAQVRDGARAILPGAEIRRRLYFRYTILWRKP